MPHIHTKPDQHDMTVSAYIIRQDQGTRKCLVHFHKKIEKLMQIGGHIELTETPWQALAHEVEEESGYCLEELSILQPTPKRLADEENVTHPIPFALNTHNVGNEHYHSDLCYGLVAKALPKKKSADSESDDLRWLTRGELQQAVHENQTPKDVFQIYEFLLSSLGSYVEVATDGFSLKKPDHNLDITYQRGAAGE